MATTRAVSMRDVHQGNREQGRASKGQLIPKPEVVHPSRRIFMTRHAQKNSIALISSNRSVIFLQAVVNL